MKDINYDHHKVTHNVRHMSTTETIYAYAYQHGINENSSVSRFISFDPVVANMDITGFASIDTVSLLTFWRRNYFF